MIRIIISLLFMIPLRILSSVWINLILFFIYFIIFLFIFPYYKDWNFISYLFGFDLLSYFIILLRVWICSLIILASGKLIIKNNYKVFFIINIYILLLILLIVFSSIRLLRFYLFFEMSLIPTLLLIIGWGYQPERLQAGIYMLFYTLVASLPILISIFFILYSNYTIVFFLINNLINSLFIFFLLNIVFLVKIPIYLVHLWLPKAHVEAPVSGSIILAGVILKLGGYGILRTLNIFILVNIKVNIYVIIFRLIGGVIASFICIRQVDIKCLIAYSSVAHISIVLSGILVINYWGICGSFILILAHGLCSSGLFCLANINYERIYRRRFYLNKGIINIIPSLRLYWFLLNSSNIAAPPSLNLVGEVILINSLVSWSRVIIVVLVFLSFFRAVYSLYLFSISQHGNYSISLYSVTRNYLREYHLLRLHWIPLNLLIFIGDIFIWL